MIHRSRSRRSRFLFGALLFAALVTLQKVHPTTTAPDRGEDSLLAGKVVGLDAFYNNEWKDLPGGGRVRYHYVWDDTANSGFSILGRILTDMGAVLETRTSAPTAAGLSALRAYIIVDPDTPKESPDPHTIASCEADTLEAWVRAGGTLLLLGNDQGNAEFARWNGLAERFGVHFNEDSRHRVVGTAFAVGTCDSFPPHPVWNEVRRVYLKEVSSLRLTPPAVPLLVHDGFVLAATSTVGAGCVVAVGDPWLYNEYMDARRLPPDTTTVGLRVIYSTGSWRATVECGVLCGRLCVEGKGNSLMAVKRGSPVTLSDIARRVKVSKVTVSKALRGHPDISSDTVRRIKAVARELGYSPNFWARNLSSRRSSTIGVIVPKIAHFFFSAVIEAIYDAAFANNYEIILTVSAENAERERRHIESLLSMRVDGLMVSVSQETRNEAVFDSVASMGVPLTFIDRMVETDRFNSVVADDRGGAFAATEQAISIGYRKLAILGGFQHTNIGRERYRGFTSALKRYDIPVRPEWIVHGGFSEDDGYRGFKRLFEAGTLPEFIFAVTFPVTLGVYRAADELGIRIPDDVDIICFGNSGVNRFLNPPVSYVEQPTRELGRRALELTLENIQQRDTFPQHIVLPTTLVLSKTCVKKAAGRKKG